MIRCCCGVLKFCVEGISSQKNLTNWSNFFFILQRYTTSLLEALTKQAHEQTTMRPTFCRDWNKDCEGNIVKEILWRNDWEREIVKERLRKKDCERKTAIERLWMGDRKTDWEWKIERETLKRCGESFLTFFPHFGWFQKKKKKNPKKPKNVLRTDGWTNGWTDRPMDPIIEMLWRT